MPACVNPKLPGLHCPTPEKRRLSEFGFWPHAPLAATMLRHGRLATDPSAYPQGESGHRRGGKTRRTLRTHARCHGGIRIGAVAGESRRARRSRALVHGCGGAIPQVAVENQGRGSAGAPARAGRGARGIRRTEHSRRRSRRAGCKSGGGGCACNFSSGLPGERQRRIPIARRARKQAGIRRRPGRKRISSGGFGRGAGFGSGVGSRACHSGNPRVAAGETPAARKAGRQKPA